MGRELIRFSLARFSFLHEIRGKWCREKRIKVSLEQETCGVMAKGWEGYSESKKRKKPENKCPKENTANVGGTIP